MSAEARLIELEIALPAPTPPGANRMPAVQTGSLVYLSERRAGLHMRY